MKKHLIAALLLIGTLHAWGQEVPQEPPARHFDFALDSTSFLIGDQTVLSIVPQGYYPSLEELSNNDIVALRQWVDSANGTLLTLITSFEEGEHWYHIGDDSVLLTVKDVPDVDTSKADIKDIANILRQPYTFGEVARTVGIVLGIAALLAAIVYAVWRWKHHKRLIPKPEEPQLPPDVRALAALEELRQQQLWQQGKAKEYHTRLTDIVRAYLEETYGIPSTEMTTDQTLEAFAGCPAHSEENANRLRQMLQTADLVKFAKSEPLPYQHDNSMSQAVDFVRDTAPKAPAADTDDTPSGNTPYDTDSQNPNTQQ